MIDKHSEIYVFRILDAAINRAGEGIRVVEDYARMVLEDAILSQQLKQLRHDLTQAVAGVDPHKRIAARDTLGDVGATLQSDSEYKRVLLAPGIAEARVGESTVAPSGGVVQANFSRAQQAMRTIEEFSKLLNSDWAKQVEQIRYQTYTIEKAVLTTNFSLQALADAHLYVLIDGSGDLESLIPSLIQARVSLIQLRDKSFSDRQLVETGRRISNLTRGTATRLIMNDRADLAVAANADGVHLGQDDLSVGNARRIVGEAMIIGVSTHSMKQARQSVLDGANYIGVGPVFPSKTKHFDSHVGFELLAEVAQEVALPSYAIGGINLDNLEQVARTGFTRVAVSAAVTQAKNPGDVARKFKQALVKFSG